MRKIIVITFLFLSNSLLAQKVIDEIVAVIGDEIVLTSDIETQYNQYLSQGFTNRTEIRCQIIEDLLYQKLLLNDPRSCFLLEHLVGFTA